MKITSNRVSKNYKIKKGIFKTYDIKVIEDFNYEINQGDIIGIIGVEGSGKSTLVNLLSARIKPDEGEILVDGEINYKKLKENCEIISSFKDRKLIGNDSVYNNLVCCGNKYKIDSLSIEKNISVFKDVFELDKSINKKVNELDELELIKVNLVISMLKNIPVLFFDSALSNLNVIEKNIVLRMLKRLNKEYKTTIVVSGDNLIDIEKICKKITIINKGKIVKNGLFDDLKKELFNKEIRIIFNKSFMIPKGDFEIIECSDYFLRIRIDFEKCDFACLINQFDINTIVDINIYNVPVSEL